jgi:hypothetical protein
MKWEPDHLRSRSRSAFAELKSRGMQEDWGGGFLVEQDQQEHHLHFPHAAAHGPPRECRPAGTGGGDYEGGASNEGCMECGSSSFNSAWAQTFGVLLCEGCRRSYKLISKSAALSAYLLTDKDLRKLGHISKANPQHPSWTAMQLYLQVPHPSSPPSLSNPPPFSSFISQHHPLLPLPSSAGPGGGRGKGQAWRPGAYRGAQAPASPGQDPGEAQETSALPG